MLNNGNLGVGTATPNAPLQFSNTNGNRKIVLFEDNNNHEYYGFGINPGTLRYQIGGSAASHVFFKATSATTSTELMRITGSGRVGIATSIPGNRLEVNSSTAGQSGLRFTNMNSSSTPVTVSVAALGVNANGDVVVASSSTADILARGRFNFCDVGGGAVSGISVSGNINIASVNKTSVNNIVVNFPAQCLQQLMYLPKCVVMDKELVVRISSQTTTSITISMTEWTAVSQNIQIDLMVLR